MAGFHYDEKGNKVGYTDNCGKFYEVDKDGMYDSFGTKYTNKFKCDFVNKDNYYANNGSTVNTSSGKSSAPFSKSNYSSPYKSTSYNASVNQPWTETSGAAYNSKAHSKAPTVIACIAGIIILIGMIIYNGNYVTAIISAIVGGIVIKALVSFFINYGKVIKWFVIGCIILKVLYEIFQN